MESQRHPLVRIVRMRFTPEGVDAFLEIFHANYEAIRHFSGCTHLDLLRDVSDPLCYSTLSHWDSEDALEQYRKSELFSSVWGRVKPLFAERPVAWSMRREQAL